MGKTIDLIGFVLVFFVVGCNGSAIKDQATTEKTVELLNIDTWGNQVVLNEDGIFLQLDGLGEAKYLVKWGKNSNTYSVDTVQILPSGNAQITILKNRGMYIQQGCGTACFFAYVLSFQKDKAMYYFLPLAIDLKQSLVAFNGEDAESLIVVENFISQKRQTINADYFPGAYPGQAIDSISFESCGRLFIRWLDSDRNQKEGVFTLSGL